MIRFTLIRNGYYGVPVWEFNLPAGHSCPFARECLASADKQTGKITKGEHMEFACYAAGVERYPAVRALRWENFETLKTMTEDQMFNAIREAHPKNAALCRIHGGGDFFNQKYFDAWLRVCNSRPTTQHWAFTKSIRYWVRRIKNIPPNLTLQASYGGTEDALIEKYGLKFAKVFMTLEEAEASGLPIDTDDTLAMRGSRSFALVENRAMARSKRDRN